MGNCLAIRWRPTFLQTPGRNASPVMRLLGNEICGQDFGQGVWKRRNQKRPKSIEESLWIWNVTIILPAQVGFNNIPSCTKQRCTLAKYTRFELVIISASFSVLLFPDLSSLFEYSNHFKPPEFLSLSLKHRHFYKNITIIVLFLKQWLCTEILNAKILLLIWLVIPETIWVEWILQ